MKVYYNEIESFPCDVIRANIARGRLPEGFVDQRDIQNVTPTELIGCNQLHLFAGIGAAAYACRLAGLPDDFSICTFGFPCQDISVAGKGAGLEGSRSGMFFEAVRLIDGARPTWLLAENVPALRNRGANRVLAELEGIGYTVLDPIVVGADDIGAPHRRKRVWIVARLGNTQHDGLSSAALARSTGTTICNNAERSYCAVQSTGADITGKLAAENQKLDDAERKGLEGFTRHGVVQTGWQNAIRPVAEASLLREWPSRIAEQQYDWEEPRTTQSQVGGATDGPTGRLVRDRGRHRKESIKALGNAWVPQTAVPILKWMHQQECEDGNDYVGDLART